MTPSEILALLSGVATGSIGTGLIANAIYDSLKNSYALLPITSDRKKAVSKIWNGAFTQATISYSIKMDLKAKRKRIVGTGEYSDGSKKVNIVVTGGFYRDDHLHLSYRNKDRAAFQHGLIVLHFPNNPTTLTGKFVGIGLDSNQIVGGDIALNA